jgi:hypothetical protein
MQIRSQDLAATLLAAFVVAVTLAVTQAWNWPLLTDARAGMIAVTVAGFGMCALASAGMKAAPGPPAFMFASGALGVIALALVVYGLIVGTQTALVVLAAMVVALWFISTVRHMFATEFPPSGEPSVG